MATGTGTGLNKKLGGCDRVNANSFQERLHRDTGGSQRDCGGLLAHVVGAQLHHRGDADQAQGNGAGENIF